VAPKLYDYYRSTAAYRVRIALNLKGIDYEKIPVNLKPGLDEQHSTAYRLVNPQSRVPTYVDGFFNVGQSSAILEYLEETHPEPALLPRDPVHRAKVRELCAIIGCDIHPVNNLSILQYLKNELNVDPLDVQNWYSHWIHQGFGAIEAHLERSELAGHPYCFGEHLSMADLYLTAQVYNANRFDVDISAYPLILEIDAACQKLPEFNKAAPENH